MTAPVTRYPVGTVAIATVRGVSGIRVFLYTHPDSTAYACWCSAEPVATTFLHSSIQVTDITPLVVLRASDVDNAARYIRAATHYPNAYVKTDALRIANELEEQNEHLAGVSVGPEPTNPAARYKDADGCIWARWGDKWFHLSAGIAKGARGWDELNLVHGPLEEVNE